MTIDVCEAKGGGRSQASRGRSRSRNYGGSGAGDEGKEFYRTANIWSLAWGF